MTYFEQLLALPTIRFTKAVYHPHPVKRDTLGKLRVLDDGTLQAIVYGPDAGYAVQGQGMEDEADYLTFNVTEKDFDRYEITTKMDQFIAKGMLDYPSIFPSREEVLVHAFLVLGNGYEWGRGGVLTDRGYSRGPVNYARPRMKYEPLTIEKWPMRDFYSRISDKRSSRLSEDEGEDSDSIYDDMMQEAFDKWLVDAKKKNQDRRRRELFLDFYVKSKSKYNLVDSHYESVVSIARLVQSNYLPMSNIPDVVDRSFLEGMVEILKKAVVSTRGYWKHVKALDLPESDGKETIQQMRRRAVAGGEVEVEDPEVAAEKELTRIREVVNPSARAVEHLAEQIEVRIRDQAWSYVKIAQRALTAIGFSKKSEIDSSNGTGWVGHYPPRLLSEDDLIKFERRLKNKGFVKDGLLWTRDQWFVKVSLTQVGDRYRAAILIMTHPEDREALREVMERSFRDGWTQHLRWDVGLSFRYHEKLSLAESQDRAHEMTEVELEDRLKDKPVPKRDYD